MAESTTLSRRGNPGITELGVMESDPTDRQPVLMSVHPGVTVEEVRAATGRDLRIAVPRSVPPAPTDAELVAVRAMSADTDR